jgi:hypothetical protein
MSNLRREYSHVVDEQSRDLQEVSLREGEARSQMEALIRQKAEIDVEINTLQDKVTALKDEVERLRRQVYELQQESADKEVKIVQLTKQRAKDKEDLQGMNIALDSKQQELELVRISSGLFRTLILIPSRSFLSSNDDWEFEERQAAHPRTQDVPLTNANLVRLPHLVSLDLPPVHLPPVHPPPCPIPVPLPKIGNRQPNHFQRPLRYLLWGRVRG